MKTRMLTFFVVLTFALLSCEQQDGLEQSDDLSEMQLKAATLAVNDIAIESVALEANYETDFYLGYEHQLRQLAHFKGGKGNLLKGHNGLHYLEGQSPMVSIDTTGTGYPIVITIDYGDSTATKKGRVLSGTVIIELSGKKGSDGSTRTISYIGCSIDSIGIEGTSIQAFTSDSTDARQMTISSELTFTLADGTIVNRVEGSVREWLTVQDTLLENTYDRVQITGTIEVESSAGDSYKRLITEPLIKLEDCRHPVQGIVEYSVNGSMVAELNYGDGSCDNLALLTTEGETIEIELQGKMPKAKLDGHFNGNKGHKGGNGGH